jgi:hypothetical protein
MSDARRSTVPVTLALAALGLAALLSLPVMRSKRAYEQRVAMEVRGARAQVAGALDSLRPLVERAQAGLAREKSRAEARRIEKLHLVIAVDSGTVALMRDGIALRTMPARFTGGVPARGAQTIARITASRAVAAAPTVDSLGNTIATIAAEAMIERVTLSDGVTLEGGDAGASFLGGVTDVGGPRTIVVSRRDFAAIRPNLVRGMPAYIF